jgi:flagellar motility protein MotE (MotC chaperone)
MSGYQDFFKAKRNVANKKSPLKPAPKKSSPPTGKKKSKLWATIYTLVASVLAGASIWYLSVGEDQAKSLLSRVQISVLGAAQAEDTAKPAESGPKTEEKKSADSAPEPSVAKEPKRTWTDEEVSLFTKLEERKKDLDTREASLNKLEEELQKQKEDLEKRLASLEDVRGKIAAKLEDKVKSDGDKVTALVSVFSNMKPAQAAKIIEGLNEDLAVEVLTKMKNKSAAEILNTMDSEKAKHLSERFAGFKQAAN